MTDKFDEAKYEFILDAMRRATANGTHAEVARALAADWNPSFEIGKDGSVTVKLAVLRPHL